MQKSLGEGFVLGSVDFNWIDLLVAKLTSLVFGLQAFEV